MIVSRLFRNIWPILLGSGVVFGFAACSGVANFASIPDHFSDFRRANLLASDQASLKAGQEVLDIGGNAADVTVAMGFAAMISLPARMGLAAKGHCVGYDSASATPFSLDFNKPEKYAVHGLSALHAGYGKTPWSGVLAPAQKLALLGSGLFSTTLNDAPARDHLIDARGALLPRPVLLKNLQTLAKHPINYARFAPFADDAEWQSRLSMDFPKILSSDGTSLAYAGTSFTHTRTSSVVFGAVDEGGLAISCSAGYARPYGMGWDSALDSARPGHSVELPRNIVSYNDHNQRTRWLAAFAGDVSETTILASWNALLEDSKPKIDPGQGFAMSYCPIGLPNKQFNQGLLCGTYTGAVEVLGRAARH